MSARTQQILCGFEDKVLAPYAVHADALRGRHYPETPHPYRTEFQRDRDRILHSQAFRRLALLTIRSLFVLPMGSDTVLSSPMHVIGSDLDLKRLTGRPNKCRMK